MELGIQNDRCPVALRWRTPVFLCGAKHGCRTKTCLRSSRSKVYQKTKISLCRNKTWGLGSNDRSRCVFVHACLQMGFVTMNIIHFSSSLPNIRNIVRLVVYDRVFVLKASEMEVYGLYFVCFCWLICCLHKV